MNRYSMRVTWSDEDDAFVATCPEFGDLSALGASAAEAASELDQVISLAIEAFEEEERELPEPAGTPRYSGQFRVRLPKNLHAWLVQQADDEGVSLNSLVVSCLSEAKGVSQGKVCGHRSVLDVLQAHQFTSRSADLLVSEGPEFGLAEAPEESLRSVFRYSGSTSGVCFAHADPLQAASTSYRQRRRW